MTPLPHITVCVCTFQRAHFLKRLLEELAEQETEGGFTYSVVVADNDQAESARETVEAFQKEDVLEVSYCVEPEQNIALARNRALSQARGEFIAFLDDDEYPETDWLLQLVKTCRLYEADGVLGPVLPRFEDEPPAWVVKGRFCDRPRHETGFRLDWHQSRTGNLLFRHELLSGVDLPFRPQFGSGGEDRDFFKRQKADGRKFVWCNEAVVHEWVPACRVRRGFMLRRALLRGKASLSHGRSMGDAAKSLLAVAAYSLALPALFVLGQHWFMKYLIKICDHSGKLLALVGLNPIRDSYVTE